MADVYLGTDTLLGRKVAIKILHAQFSNDEAFVKRFRREAQAAANLTHPNIVGIYDWGQANDTYFIVMELVEGRSLRDVLRSDGALLSRRAAEIAAEAASALSGASRRVGPPRCQARQHPPCHRRHGEGHRLRHRSGLG